MQSLMKYVRPKSTILEFGTGLGGNLTSISNEIQSGCGIDINSLYVAQARKLANWANARNIEFTPYDGEVIPSPENGFDFVFSIGVFERLPVSRVKGYVGQLARRLRPDGHLALYFLSPRARQTTFTRRLGASAYTYWSPYDARALIESVPLRVIENLEWGFYPLLTGGGALPVADVYLCDRRTT